MVSSLHGCYQVLGRLRGAGQPGAGWAQKNTHEQQKQSPPLQHRALGRPPCTSTNKIRQLVQKDLCLQLLWPLDNSTQYYTHYLQIVHQLIKKNTYFTNSCLGGLEEAFSWHVLCTGITHAAFAASFHQSTNGNHTALRERRERFWGWGASRGATSSLPSAAVPRGGNLRYQHQLRLLTRTIFRWWVPQPGAKHMYLSVCMSRF